MHFLSIVKKNFYQKTSENMNLMRVKLYPECNYSSVLHQIDKKYYPNNVQS